MSSIEREVCRENKQNTIQKFVQLFKKRKEQNEKLVKSSSDQVGTLLERISQFQSRIVSCESKYEEAQGTKSQLLMVCEKENKALRTTVASYRSEIFQLKQDVVAMSEQMDQLKQENSKMKREKWIQSFNNDPSVDPTILKLLEDKEACESQIEFMNSIIVDMWKKNNDLKSRIQISKVVDLPKKNLDVKLNDIKKPILLVAPCLGEPQPTENLGIRLRITPYCDICEIVGHWTFECDDDDSD